MGLTAANIKVGTALPPLVKQLTLQQMLLFSSGEGRVDKVNLHTDAAAAQRDTGMKQPFASGRISMGYACELMSRFVGLDEFGRMRLQTIVSTAMGIITYGIYLLVCSRTIEAIRFGHPENE